MLRGKSYSCLGYSVDSQAPPVLDGTPPWPFGLGVEGLRKCSDEVVNSNFMLGVWGWLLETTRMEDFIRKLWSGDPHWANEIVQHRQNVRSILRSMLRPPPLCWSSAASKQHVTHLCAETEPQHYLLSQNFSTSLVAGKCSFTRQLGNANSAKRMAAFM